MAKDISKILYKINDEAEWRSIIAQSDTKLVGESNEELTIVLILENKPYISVAINSRGCASRLVRVV